MLSNKLNPFYLKRFESWNFFEETYKGGVDYINKHLQKQSSFEKDEELKTRKSYAYFPNYSQQILDILVSYICNNANVSGRENYPEDIRKYLENIDGEGSSIQEFMEAEISETLKFGVSGILVDSNKVNNVALTKADEKELGIRPLLKTFKPFDILNYYKNDQTNELEWIYLKEDYIDNSDFNKINIDTCETRYIYISKNIFEYYNTDEKLVSFKTNELGVVPFVFLTTKKVKNYYDSPSLIEDVARIDKNIMNNLSLLDRIIVNQTFSIKVVEEGENETINQEDVNNIDTKSTQVVPKGSKMYFVAPDASQSNVIISKVERDVNEIHRKFSLMSSDTKQESGVAKSFNFSNFNSALAKIASYFENAEKKILEIFGLYLGLKDVEKNINPVYNKIFDIFTLQQDLIATADILELSKIYSSTATRKLIEKIVYKALPNLSFEEKIKIDRELKEASKKQINKINIFDGEDMQSEKSDNENENQKKIQTGSQTVQANLDNYNNLVKTKNKKKSY